MIQRFIKNTAKRLTVLSLLFFSTALLTIANAVPKEANLQKSLSIADSKINYTTYDGYNSISCIGTIENHSNVKWLYPVIEVQFFNSNNELIDTITDRQYNMVVPANDSVAFRLDGQPDKAKSEYVSHQVRITSAEQVKKCKSKSKKKFSDVLLTLLPAFLIIFFFTRYSKISQGKNSPQNRIIENQEKSNKLIEEQHKMQNKLMEEQNKLLSDIADAIKNKS